MPPVVWIQALKKDDLKKIVNLIKFLCNTSKSSAEIWNITFPLWDNHWVCGKFCSIYRHLEPPEKIGIQRNYTESFPCIMKDEYMDVSVCFLFLFFEYMWIYSIAEIKDKTKEIMQNNKNAYFILSNSSQFKVFITSDKNESCQNNRRVSNQWTWLNTLQLLYMSQGIQPLNIFNMPLNKHKTMHMSW